MNPNQGNATTMMWLSQQQRKVEYQTRLRMAKTLAEAVRLASISIPPQIRFMKNSIPGLRSLENAVGRRLEELVTERLALIEAKPTAAEAKTERGRFMQECIVLRGTFARQYGIAERESARLVYLKEKVEKPVGDDAEAVAP